MHDLARVRLEPRLDARKDEGGAQGDRPAQAGQDLLADVVEAAAAAGAVEDKVGGPGRGGGAELLDGDGIERGDFDEGGGGDELVAGKGGGLEML